MSVCLSPLRCRTVTHPCRDCRQPTRFDVSAETVGMAQTVPYLCPACLAARVQAVLALRDAAAPRVHRHPRPLAPATQAALAHLQTLRARHPEWTITQLARALTAAGLRTATGTAWTSSKLAALGRLAPRVPEEAA